MAAAAEALARVALDENRLERERATRALGEVQPNHFAFPPHLIPPPMPPANHPNPNPYPNPYPPPPPTPILIPPRSPRLISLTHKTHTP